MAPAKMETTQPAVALKQHAHTLVHALCKLVIVIQDERRFFFFTSCFSKCAKPALNAARRTSEVIFSRNPFILFKTGDDMRRFSLWRTLIFSSNNSAETGNSLFYYGDDDDSFFLTGPRRPRQFAAADFSLCRIKLTPISVIMPSSRLINTDFVCIRSSRLPG